MKIIRSHKIAVDPTHAQENVLRQAVGCARFAYNWALGEWKRLYEAGDKPTEMNLRKHLNGIKRESFPWMLNVPKSTIQQSIKNLGTAFQRFFRKQGKYPVFHKKGQRDSARMDNGPGTFKVEGKRIWLSKLNWIRTKEELRFSGRPLSAVVSCEAGRWFVAVQVEVEHTMPEREPSSVGVDLGVTTAVTLSTGEKFAGPRPLKKSLRTLKRLQQHLSRKVKGSKRREKCKAKLARLHARIRHIREDWTHKVTTEIVRRFSLIGIETLNVRGMLRNHKLARAISDIGFHEISRQLEYKAAMHGATVVPADMWFPSSKMCSHCGVINENLKLGTCEWTCDCGQHHDRDVNAAVNLKHNAVSCTAIAHVEGNGSGQRCKSLVKPASVKRVPNLGTKCL